MEIRMADISSSKAALYGAISDALDEAKDWPLPARAAALRELAWAWRALTGGQQPGGTVPDTK